MNIAQRLYVALVGLAAAVPFGASADDGGTQLPAPGVLGLLLVGGVAAGAAMWRNRRK